VLKSAAYPASEYAGSAPWAILRSGSSTVAALDNVPFHPYSDFLLHDMGSLGDGISQGDASGGEMRTAPLWGLRMITKFLHDGRASTISAAIAAHDGQARNARDRFNALDASSNANPITRLCETFAHFIAAPFFFPRLHREAVRAARFTTSTR